MTKYVETFLKQRLRFKILTSNVSLSFTLIFREKKTLFVVAFCPQEKQLYFYRFSYAFHSFWLSPCLLFRLSVCVSICLTVCLFVFLSNCNRLALNLHLCFCFHVYLFFFSFVTPSLFIFPSSRLKLQ